ncbi:MFS transporter [Yinghuangia soli]|uniref:MFS transporter n=1 Tax=Yinghuangia soli TaxID=2908204 RepID=A0AA41PYU5_9ACTN|nr:MFS transporter [Yinghuangia soli]MCF2528443.1 MFS transporter [Yinghuangia soli]
MQATEPQDSAGAAAPIPGRPDDGAVRRARLAVLACFLIQGASFAVLVTRVPAIQDRYGLGDGGLTLVLSLVPIIAGLGSAAAEKLAARYGSHHVLRIAQPVVCASVIGVGAGDQVWQLAAVLVLFGLALGAVDATMNMQAVGIQARQGRSVMNGFHAAWSLGGIAGAGLATFADHKEIALVVMYAISAAITAPAAFLIGRRYLPTRPERPAVDAPGAAAAVPWRTILPLCAVMTFVYIGDSAVSSWGAVYAEDVQHMDDNTALPYLVYMVTALVGRSIGDLGVRRWGALPVVRAGALTAAAGFAVVVAAPGAAVALAGFTVLGLGICVLVPQTFAAGAATSPHDPDTAIARLNLFNYAGFLIGTPLVGVVGDLAGFRAAMALPLVLVLAVLPLARAFAPQGEAGHGNSRETVRDR